MVAIAVPKVKVVRNSICECVACTLLTDPAEIEREVNAVNPTGIDSPWRIHPGPFASGQPNPCPCDGNYPNRKHYLLSC